MLYLKYIDEQGTEKSKLFFSWEEYSRETFSPAVEQIALINFRISGYGYKKKKEAAREIATAWSIAGDTTGLSWLDVCRISEWFYTMGRRFGLLSEFQENGLC